MGKPAEEGLGFGDGLGVVGEVREGADEFPFQLFPIRLRVAALEDAAEEVRRLLEFGVLIIGVGDFGLRLDDQRLVVGEVVELEFEGGGHDGVELGDGEFIHAHLAVKQPLPQQHVRHGRVLGIKLKVLQPYLLGFGRLPVVLHDLRQIEQGLALQGGRSVGLEDAFQNLRRGEEAFVLPLPPGHLQFDFQVRIRLRLVGRGGQGGIGVRKVRRAGDGGRSRLLGGGWGRGRIGREPGGGEVVGGGGICVGHIGRASRCQTGDGATEKEWAGQACHAVAALVGLVGISARAGSGFGGGRRREIQRRENPARHAVGGGREVLEEHLRRDSRIGAGGSGLRRGRGVGRCQEHGGGERAGGRGVRFGLSAGGGGRKDGGGRRRGGRRIGRREGHFDQIGRGLRGGKKAQGGGSNGRQIAGAGRNGEGEAQQSGPPFGPMAQTSKHQEMLLFSYRGYRRPGQKLEGQAMAVPPRPEALLNSWRFLPIKM